MKACFPWPFHPRDPPVLRILGRVNFGTRRKSEGPKGGRRKGGRGRKLLHFSFCCAFRCCVVYSPCFPVWGEEKVMTIYDAGPLASGPLCGLLRKFGTDVAKHYGEGSDMLVFFWAKEAGKRKQNTTDSSAVLCLAQKGPLGNLWGPSTQSPQSLLAQNPLHLSV